VVAVSFFSLLPAEYGEGVYVFLFLMTGRITDMYFGLNGIIFITSKKFKYDLIFTSFLVITVFVLNLWLIPVYGMSGAAISTAIALIIYNTGRMLFVYFAYKMHPFEWNQVKVIALFLALVFCFEFIFPHIQNFFWSVGINSIVFCICFAVPIVYWRWNPDLNNYTIKGYGFLKSRFIAKKS
jgi:O-antigen/teichoic acid export membrane protein